MAAEDLFPDVEIGQTIGMVDEQSIPCVVGAGGVTKGYFVGISDLDSFPPTVVAAGAAASLGAAMQTGVEGDTVDVLVEGVMKMVAGGAFIAGDTVKSDATHRPITGGIYADGGGKSLQKAGELGDEVLIWVGAK